MPHRPKLLILMSQTGGGHLSTAEALRDQLEHYYIIKIVELYPKFFYRHYRFTGRHALWLYSIEYRLSSTQKMSMLVHQIFARLISTQLNIELDSFQPDGVISTHPYLTYEVKRVLDKRSSKIPLILLFSDPHLTSHWSSERDATATLAPTRETYEQALSIGFDPKKLHLVGWPVRSQFYNPNPLERTEILTKISFDPGQFTIFLQGGAEGTSKIEQTVENVLSIDKDIQVILAAGTNQSLIKRFKSIKKNLYVLPFTSEISPFMAAAAVIMGKAGANTIFEAVTLHKPFIATSYIPGQEGGNLEFLQQNELGWIALNREKLEKLVIMLASRNDALNTFITRISEYRQWNYSGNQSMVTLIRSLLPTTELQ